jgi:hypothetical protein
MGYILKDEHFTRSLPVDPLDLIAVRHPRFSLHSEPSLDGHARTGRKLSRVRDAVTSLSGGRRGRAVVVVVGQKCSCPARQTGRYLQEPIK